MRPTPEATIGPFFPGAFVDAMPQDLWQVSSLTAHHPQGEPIVLEVRVFDAHNRPVPSVVIEFWQANAQGRYRHPADQSTAALDPQFDGFARLRTNDEGIIRLHTIKPGASGVRAPHIRLTIFASGIDRVITQVFFADESSNGSDPLLNSMSEDDRARLTARIDAAAGAPRNYVFDLVMRGDRETPFFDDWSE